jgi:dephospho-CoA kinase
MKSPIIIAFVGMPGSGKGTCGDYLSQKYGWRILHFGNMVYEEVAKRGLHNVNDEKFVREDMRKQEGPAVLAKRIAKTIQNLDKHKNPVVILDGLYSWSEYTYLNEQFGEKLLVVATTAPKKLRRERVLNRKDSHRKYTLEELTAREISEIENLEKGGPIAFADYTLNNSTNNLVNLFDQLESVLAESSIVPRLT